MADDNVESTAPIATEAPSEATKPDYVQDKFWNVDTKQVNIENLSSSYNTLEKKLGTRTEDISKQIRGDIEKERLNKVPESYKLNVPEIPQNVDLKVDKEMELVKWWDATAKGAGLSQEQYDKGVQAFVDNALSQLPNQDLETQKLGDNGKDRVQAAEMWSKKHLSPEGYNNFAKLASTAEGVKVIEELMKLNKDSSMPVQNTQMDISASADDLKSMLNDPRYYDSSKRDPAYVKRVTELYEKAYKNSAKES
tara:strand:+ start:828 stop:1583 length:756 start_codon:yes stop_codon:yes gene_type:complete